MYQYADVLLPLALPGAFTYTLSPAMAERVRIGMRVIVPLGSRKQYTAIIVRLHDEPPAVAPSQVRAVIDVVDTAPVVTPGQIALWRWVADYYMCTPGEVMKAALPSGLKMESETMVRRNPDFAGDVDPAAMAVYDLLREDEAKSIDALGREAGIAHPLRHVRALLECGAALVEEKMQRSYRPRTQTRLRPGPALLAAGTMEDVLLQLRRTPRQLDVMCLYLHAAGLDESSAVAELAAAPAVVRSELAAQPGFSDSALMSLRRKGWLETYTAEVERLKVVAPTTAEGPALSEEQQNAVDSIEHAWADHRVCLLHGVTSSGKTEVYAELIRRTLSEGRQVLYLVPEIALTTQLTTRLGRLFGDRMGVYHSKFPDAERVELWRRQLSDRPFPLILGVRSSVFLPFRDLGLIIVDEEHEPSYKQQDPAPRYNARDTAIVLAHATRDAHVLLGTATPAIETYYNATERHKYGYVRMTRRYSGVELPEIVVEDVKELHRKRLMPTPFSPRLIDEVRAALADGGQAILFYNRRGYAPVITCRSCGWTPHCAACDVPLTYHRRLGGLVCHYCGAVYQLPAVCPQCGESQLHDVGYGTEKVEDAVSTCFPEARTARMDLDTTRSRTAYERIIADFAEGRANLLVGTQMVTKGLDFDRVRVVGILNADQALSVPDFRAYERAYQMLSQVAGRAGRRGRRGRVILQTRQASLPLIRQVVEGDYEAMYRSQVVERSRFGYPPFSRLIYIYVKHREERVCHAAAQEMARLLRPHFDRALLGPDRPAVSRVQRLFIRKLMLKVSPAIPTATVRQTLSAAADTTRGQQAFRAVQIYFDVDPMG